MWHAFASPPSGSAQCSVWSVLYLYARTFVWSTVGRLFVNLIVVGMFLTFTRTGPRYVSWFVVGQLAPGTYPQVQVPVYGAPLGRTNVEGSTFDLNSQVESWSGLVKEVLVATIVARPLCPNLVASSCSCGSGSTNWGMLLPAIGTCGEGAARAVPAIETAAKMTLSDVRYAFTVVISCDTAVLFVVPQEKPHSPSEKGARVGA